MKIRNTEVVIVQGDITRQDAEAIVNAANSSLMGGGGVDGAIHRAGGPSILRECREIRNKQWPDGLPTGEVAVTSAGNLKAKFVLHTVGPVWRGGTKNEENLLRKCYTNTLEICDSRKISSVSFPSISTGAYGYPIEYASRIALEAVKEYIITHETEVKEVRFILFSEPDMKIYEEAAKDIFK